MSVVLSELTTEYEYEYEYEKAWKTLAVWLHHHLLVKREITNDRAE